MLKQHQAIAATKQKLAKITWITRLGHGTTVTHSYVLG